MSVPDPFFRALTHLGDDSDSSAVGSGSSALHEDLRTHQPHDDSPAPATRTAAPTIPQGDKASLARGNSRRNPTTGLHPPTVPAPQTAGRIVVFAIPPIESVGGNPKQSMLHMVAVYAKYGFSVYRWEASGLNDTVGKFTPLDNHARDTTEANGRNVHVNTDLERMVGVIFIAPKSVEAVAQLRHVFTVRSSDGRTLREIPLIADLIDKKLWDGEQYGRSWSRGADAFSQPPTSPAYDLSALNMCTTIRVRKPSEVAPLEEALAAAAKRGQ